MHKRLTLILAGLTMVGPLAIDTYLPAFPAIGQTFQVSQLLVQQTLSAFLFTFSFMMLFYGTLSDSFGRRPVILIALGVYTLGSIAAFFASSFSCLMIARIIQGFASGAGSVVGRAIVQDTVQGPYAQRMLSHIMMVFGLAPAIAPIAGGWLHVHYGWRTIFLFLALFSIFMLIICYRSLAESLPRSARQPFTPRVIFHNYLIVLKRSRFLNLALAVAFGYGGFSLYIGSASNFVTHILHLPATAFGWLFIPMISGMMIGSIIASRYATQISSTTLIKAGYSLMGSAVLLNIVYTALCIPALPWAVMPLMVYSCGVAIINPSITVTILSLFPGHKGLCSSLQSFLQTLIFALVSGMIAPLLYDSAFKLAMGTLGAFSFSLIFWYAGSRHTTDSPSTHSV